MTDNWLPHLASGVVKYQAVAEALGTAIKEGSLQPGDRLPPQRELATRLGVDLTTVTRAYDVARRRGLIEARGRAGSFVRKRETIDVRALSSVDAGMNMPPELPGRQLAQSISDATSALLLTESPLRLQYQSAGGSVQDRAVAAALFKQAGLETKAEQVVITAGGQNALHAILGHLVEPGDVVACATHVYPGFRGLAERLGARLTALDVIDADHLRALCEVSPPKALYVVPTNDNPTTRTLSLSERLALAVVADEFGVKVIEDDAYGALAAEPIVAITSFIPHLGWYIASTSKIISPALRVAFVRVPNVAHALRIAGDVHETIIMAPPLNVAILGRWIAEGTYDRLIASMRAEASIRQSVAREWLQGSEYDVHPEGYHLWLHLPAALRTRELADLMRPTGLSVIAAEQFAAGPKHASAVRVSLGGPISYDQLRSGLEVLHACATSSRLPRRGTS